MTMTMTKPTEFLDDVNSAITAKGVCFERSSVFISNEVPIAEAMALVRKLASIERATPWWYGDLALHVQAKAATDEELNGDRDMKQGESEEDGNIRRERMGALYVKTNAEAMGISPGHMYNCAMVSRFFRPSERDAEMTWAHHYIAMCGAGGAKGDLKKAKLWLQQAAENKWTVSDLRKQVNLAVATNAASSVPPETNPFSIVDEVDAWLQKRPALPKITAEQARAQLTRWSALVTFVRTLEEIAFPK